MRAVVIRQHGGPEVLNLEEIADPVPHPGEVVVRVKAVALNHLDLWVRNGLPGAPFHLPAITGADAAGVVHALGADVRDLTIGDPVMVLPGISCGHCARCVAGADHLCASYGILGESCDGALAELVKVPRANIVRKPDNLTFEDAAALSLTFLTSWHMLTARAELRGGETVLVQAAGSGVGVAAIQIARFLGARVLATAGSEKKRAAALELGADEVFDSRDPAWADQVRAAAPRGVDVVFEHVGGETFARSLRLLGKAGRLVTCGATTGIDAKVNLRHIFFKSQSILGSTMGPKGSYHQLVRLYERGFFRPVIDRILPLSQVREAQEALASREVFGKVVLTP
jgi:NADPH:quinone reductase-like Zn-dependent oxidoreductase